MKIICLICLYCLLSCSTRKSIFNEGKPYDKFRGFIPVDPTEYDDLIQIVDKGLMVNKEIKRMSAEQMLGFLNNETVLVSIGKETFDGKFSYLPVVVSEKNEIYKVTMDYMKFATLAVRRSGTGEVLGFKRVGVGLRLISLIKTLDANINLGDLSSIGFAAKAGRLNGTLMIEVIGIKSKDVTTILPLPSEINQTTIQNAMQALATIKSKIYDSLTTLYPQVMAIKQEEVVDNSKNDSSIVKGQSVEQIMNDNKLEIQLGSNKEELAKKLERQGFEYLLAKNARLSLQAFEECEKIFPQYHSVSEMAKLIRRTESSLQDANSISWHELYKVILKNFSWKLPSDVIERLKSMSK